jgi:hypothetical protein
MPRHQVRVEAVINAPAKLAYAIIADYRDGHPHILPKPPFVSLEVERDGTGAGTVIRCQMRVFGRLEGLPALPTRRLGRVARRPAAGELGAARRDFPPPACSDCRTGLPGTRGRGAAHHALVR